MTCENIHEGAHVTVFAANELHSCVRKSGIKGGFPITVVKSILSYKDEIVYWCVL